MSVIDVVQYIANSVIWFIAGMWLNQWRERRSRRSNESMG